MKGLDRVSLFARLTDPTGHSAAQQLTRDEGPPSRRPAVSGQCCCWATADGGGACA
jgi:hypothetical protein